MARTRDRRHRHLAARAAGRFKRTTPRARLSGRTPMATMKARNGLLDDLRLAVHDGSHQASR